MKEKTIKNFYIMNILSLILLLYGMIDIPILTYLKGEKIYWFASFVFLFLFIIVLVHFLSFRKKEPEEQIKEIENTYSKNIIILLPILSIALLLQNIISGYYINGMQYLESILICILIIQLIFAFVIKKNIKKGGGTHDKIR